jgi:hypothetical protein
MHTNNILVPEQFGFRQGSSTENAAFNLTDSVLKSINQKMQVEGIFCDLAEASDCVHHEVLLAKLHYYGNHRKVATWFRSYLTIERKKERNKEKKTEIKSLQKFSKWGTWKYGVPQGSILGPQESINTKFLGLRTNNHLNWKKYIDIMVSKLGRACYAIRLMSHISSTDTLKSIYIAFFHSIMKYGITFWGNSPKSKMIFTFQKRTVRIIAGVKSRNSCRNLSMRSVILPHPCEYMFTLMNFAVNSQDLFSDKFGNSQC